MATKSYKLRLDLRQTQPIVDSDRFTSRSEEISTVQEWLNDTREAFNAGVDYLTAWVLNMHRGAGVWREKRDGIWREWQEITTLDQLAEARSRHTADPDSCALLENHKLLDAFTSKGKTEVDAVRLAECCRTIVKEIAPPAEADQQTQMNRSDLDLLTLPDSEARNVRPKSKTKSGAKKKASGKRPGWLLEKAIWEECKCASSLKLLIERVGNREEFQSAKKDGAKKIATLKNKYENQAWEVARQVILQAHSDGRPKWEVAKQKWENKRRASEESGAVSAYRQLHQEDCLPLPGFERPSDRLKLQNSGAEWNYALWNMAGQRVRSHLGWVRRRASERLVWELLTTHFERGGWVRTKRNGKTVGKDDLAPDDIRFEAPIDEEVDDFKQLPGYLNSKWVKALQPYETDEMPKQLEGVTFGTAERLRIRKRTAKGWTKVRAKWIELIDKANKAQHPALSADDLLEAFDRMRSRKPRDFGDRRLFEWLAAPERRWLWDGTDKGEDNDCGRADQDCVSAFIAHNEHLADKPDSITFTRSDPVKHPVWPFFGENSAIEYWLSREQTPDEDSSLVLVLKQLLERQPDGSYSAVDRVKIALRGYEDFEKSFAIPEDAGEVSPKQSLVFRDDLMRGETRQGTLSGMKLTWERDELEAANRKHSRTNKLPRIFANFSCDAGDSKPPEWLTDTVGYLDKKNARDGVKGLFKVDGAIRFEGRVKKSTSEETAKPGALRPPGSWVWPKEALENGFTVRGTDLGYRTSSAGAWWRLSFSKPKGKVAWEVGTCERKSVYAVLERSATVSLPGDGETLPPDEQKLRDCLHSLRTRLNLNNVLLRIARLLTLEFVVQRKPERPKTRKRADGTTKRIGTKWKTETRNLDETEIEENCRKAAEQLLRWASTDAIKDSLSAIEHDGSLWDWLGSRDDRLKRLAELVPTTEVPTVKEAQKQDIDRDARKTKRKQEDDAFAHAVYDVRSSLATALCDGYRLPQEKGEGKRRHQVSGLRAASGLWFEFDAALMRVLSYGDRKTRKGQRTTFQDGLFLLLRRPPVTKHRDRKDEANNLPHGRTYRGGLSMSRLNFLDDVKNFVRRWSCRPRWPGDVRRVPKDAKFDRCDTEHLDNLREHRAKLIAHADVAQTLGFEQDLRRGVWLYKVAASPKDEIWPKFVSSCRSGEILDFF